MLGKTTNPLLQQTEQAIQGKVPPQLQNAFQRVVTAGLTIMYSPQSHQIMMQQLMKPGDPVSNVAEGAAKLVGELYKQSRGTLPVPVMVPAAMIFMCEGLGFLEQIGKLQVTPQIVAQATQDASHFILILLGVSQQQMHQVIAKGLARQNGATQQGKSMQQAAPAQKPRGIIASAMQGAK